MRDLGSFEILTMLFLELAEWLLLKWKQNLDCSNCRTGVLSANLWLLCGARLLLPAEEVTGEPERIASWTVVTMWEVSTGSESTELLGRQAQNFTLGLGSLWEWSLAGSRFSMSFFGDIPGTVPECVRTRGFKRSSSNLDSLPRLRNSVQLNSSDSFSLTLPSISSKTCLIWLSVIPGMDVICDWLWLGCSCAFLEKAANSRLFFSVTFFQKKIGLNSCGEGNILLL